MTAPDRHVRAGDLDHVVTGPRPAAQPQRRHRAGVDHEEVLEPPGVRHVLVPGQHEVDSGALQCLDRVARVVHHVALAAGPRHGQQVVVEDEDAQPRVVVELLLDPPVAAAADLAVVEVGLRRVDGDDRHRVLAEHGVALAEELLEVDVADVPRVVVPRHDHELLALDPVEVLPGELVLVAEPERRQVAGADHDVRPELVDLADRPLEQVGLEVGLAAVEVGDVGDDVGVLGHAGSLEAWKAASEAVATLLAVTAETPVFQAYRGAEPPRFANRIELECAKVLDYYGIPWEYEPRTFVLG